MFICALFATVFLILGKPGGGEMFALERNKAFSQYVHEVWQTQDGLPQGSILAIAQTDDGYLWLGTAAGLVRFDGVRFTTFDKRNTKEIRDNSVTALLRGKDGSLWVGTEGGLTRLKEGKFTSYTKKEGLSDDSLTSLCESRDESLWIGTRSGGLIRFKKGKFTRYSQSEGLSSGLVHSIYEGHDGSLWIGTDRGLDRFRGEKFTFYGKKDGMSDNDGMSIYEDQDGSLWVGTDGGGLDRFKDGKFTVYGLKEGLLDKDVWSICKDRDGNLWFGTVGGGLARSQGGKLASYTTKDGLSSDYVLSLHEDREGSLWIGTRGGGLNRLKDGIITSYTVKQGLSKDDVKCVYESRDGNLWIGTEGGWLNRFRDGRFTLFTKSEGLANDTVFSIYEDKDGSLWIGAGEHGLSRFKGGRFSAQQALANNDVRSIYQSRDGTLWFGTLEGYLYRLIDGQFSVFTEKERTPDNGVMCIYESRDGSLWIGTQKGGLARYKDGKFTHFSTNDGVSDNTILSLYEDEQSALWVGTRGGLTRLKQGKFTIYSIENGLFADTLYQILEDGKGNLWMSSNKGIFRVSKKELNELAQGKIQRITSFSYGPDDGMAASECAGESQPAGWKGKDGRLWFATNKGVVVIDPEHIKTNGLPPSVQIERVIINNKTFNPAPKIEAASGRGHTELHFTGLSLLAPKKVRFRYQLEGYDPDWVDSGTRRVAYYTNIPPGSYHFRVIACNNDGVWNQTGASFGLYLKPHFYQSYWFFGLCGLATLMLALGGHHLRLQSIKAQEKALTLLVDERTQKLQQEIAERKTAEEALRASETSLAHAQRIARLGNWDLDLVKNDLHWSDEVYRIFGLTPDECSPTREAFLGAVHPDDRGFVRKSVDEALKQGNPYDIDHRIILPDGSERIVHEQAEVVFDENGRAAWMVGTVQDITERQQGEEALRRSEERLRTVIQDMPALMAAFDRQGQIIAWNRECERVTGYPAEELVNNPKAAQLLYLDASYRQQIITDWCRPSQDYRDREWDLTAKHGSTRTVSWSNLSATFPVPGWASWAVGIDVTERRRAQAESEEMQRKLLQAQKLESLGVLAGGIAHDFNNLLAAILGNAGLALMKLGTASPAKRSIEQVISASERAADLTRKLLAYAGRGSLEIRAIDLSRHIRELAYLLTTAISKKVMLRLDLAEGLPAVEADPVQIQQIVMNLVMNGAEACGDNPGTVLVTTRLIKIDQDYAKHLVTGEELAPGPYVVLEVRDKGCGMDEQTKTRIFEPFFTTKFTGRGLGLSAVLGIVRSHRGGLEVTSTPGHGTSFKVFLPACGTPAESRRREPAVDLNGKGLILVVDDEPLVLEFARSTLEEYGYQVITAENGRRGFEIFRKRAADIDLVLLDMTMPEMSGEETIRAIRAVRSDVVVLLSSGYSEVEATGQFADKGLAGFIQKPYSPQTLAAKIKGALRQGSGATPSLTRQA
jgi:PAS domain S-box-containing protein